MDKATKTPKYPAFTEKQFTNAAKLTRLQPKAKIAAHLILVKNYTALNAGLEAGYSIASAKSAASRAALRVAKAVNSCPCCGRPFEATPETQANPES